MTRTATEMKKTWLVQRLEKSHVAAGPLGNDNPFAFGGGLRNGGLSSEAMDLLRGVFAFEYMGAAEFEFGAVPKALQGLSADSSRLVAERLLIPLAKVGRHWSDNSEGEPTGEATVYILARKEHLAGVKKAVKGMAARDFNLKEATHLPEVLRPGGKGSYQPRACGWLELDNGFMFFTDRDMWAATCSLFGVEVSA